MRITGFTLTMVDSGRAWSNRWLEDRSVDPDTELQVFLCHMCKCVEDNKVRDWQKKIKIAGDGVVVRIRFELLSRRMRNDANDSRPQALRDLDFGINRPSTSNQ